MSRRTSFLTGRTPGPRRRGPEPPDPLFEVSDIDDPYDPDVARLNKEYLRNLAESMGVPEEYLQNEDPAVSATEYSAEAQFRAQQRRQMREQQEMSYAYMRHVWNAATFNQKLERVGEAYRMSIGAGPLDHPKTRQILRAKWRAHVRSVQV